MKEHTKQHSPGKKKMSMQLRTQERKERIELAQQQTLLYTTLTLTESGKFVITYYLLQVQRYVGTSMIISTISAKFQQLDYMLTGLYSFGIFIQF